MKKTYRIDVDCANCANLMEEAYPQCSFYLSLLGFKTQYARIEEMAGPARAEQEERL